MIAVSYSNWKRPPRSSMQLWNVTRKLAPVNATGHKQSSWWIRFPLYFRDNPIHRLSATNYVKV